MDVNAIATVLASLDTIRRGFAAAIAVRDFNAAAAELAKLNDALISAQGAVIAQNNTVFALQKENFKLAKELAELKESVAQRRRYVLFQLGPGVSVYRVKQPDVAQAQGVEVAPELDHFVCQDCLDNRGHRVVLQRNGEHWNCNGCGYSFWTGKQASLSRYTEPDNW